MPWPTTPVPTTNLDAGTDSPALARANLLAAVQAVNEMMTSTLPPAQLPTQGLLPTGVAMDFFGSTAPSGWVLLSGRTIGSATSGATERANADCQALFTLLWNSMADAQAPVSGGRGASAAADWAANKTITLPDARGRVIAGEDDMGGTAANRLTNTGTGNPGIAGGTLGASGGVDRHTLTVAQIPAHDHNLRFTNVLPNNGVLNGVNSAGTGTAIPGTNGGGGEAHPNAQPTLVANKIIKL